MSAEASSLAGHQQLGNLVLLYDDNSISIEGDTATAFSEDVLGRYAAYGWHVQRVEDGNDVRELYAALTAAQAETARPSIISMRTVIGWPGPEHAGQRKTHGSALGAEETRATKEVLGLRPGHELLRAGRGRRARPQGRRPRPRGAQGLGGALRRPGPRRTPRARRCTSASRPARSPPAGRRPCRSSSRARRASRPAWPAARSSARSPTCCPSCGAARPTSPAATTRRWRAPTPSCPAGNRARGRQPVRPHAALRHPRARHGRGHERHRAVRRHPRVRRHLPGVQRLHARRRPAGRPHGAAGDVRVDARLDRPRRGRPDPPAGRAPRLAARRSRAWTSCGPPTPTRPSSPGAPSSSRPTARPASR